MPRLNSMRLIPLPKMLAALLLVLSALVLSGCFHSDDDDPAPAPVPDADPTGYYINTGFVNVKESDDTTQRLVHNVQGMVADGQLMILSDAQNLAYIGDFTVSGNDLNGSVTVYEAGVKVQEDVPVSGVITAGSKITGTLGGTGVANGTFGLNYAADNGPVSLEMLGRPYSWKSLVDPNIPNLSALRDATLPEPAFTFYTGGAGAEVFSGCGFDGRIEPIAGTHLYRVSVKVRGCTSGAADVETIPTYTGLVSLRGTTRLVLGLSNGEYDLSGDYFECLILFCTP